MSHFVNYELKNNINDNHHYVEHRHHVAVNPAHDNDDRYLPEQVYSIFDEACHIIEVLISDDCSDSQINIDRLEDVLVEFQTVGFEIRLSNSVIAYLRGT